MTEKGPTPLVTIRVANSSDMEAVQKCRFEVYSEMGYIEPSNYPDGREFDLYDNYSSSVVASTATSFSAIGTTRLVLGSKGILPIQNPENHAIDVSGLGSVAEISRLCVRKNFRNSRISLGMYRVLFHLVEVEKVDAVFAVVDESFLQMILWIGFPFEQIGEPKNYMGLTIPTVCKIQNVMPALQESEVANMLGVTQLFEMPFTGSLQM